jgi:hypothetical protein
MFFISLLLIATFVFTLFRVKYDYIFSIRVKTVKIQHPALAIKESYSQRYKESTDKIAVSERLLRRQAYKNTLIKTDESFFDDSDMKSEYYLVVVYNKKTETLLLSTRYYFDKIIIEKYLEGDSADKSNQTNSTSLRISTHFEEGKVFLADRFSGNVSSAIYRKYRNYIHLLLYSEIIQRNKNCQLILMARRDKQEKLMTKYVRLGFNIVGCVAHKGKLHWILLCDLKRNYTYLKLSMFSNLLLMTKYLGAK